MSAAGEWEVTEVNAKRKQVLPLLRHSFGQETCDRLFSDVARFVEKKLKMDAHSLKVVEKDILDPYGPHLLLSDEGKDQNWHLDSLGGVVSFALMLSKGSRTQVWTPLEQPLSSQLEMVLLQAEVTNIASQLASLLEHLWRQLQAAERAMVVRQEAEIGWGTVFVGDQVIHRGVRGSGRVVCYLALEPVKAPKCSFFSTEEVIDVDRFSSSIWESHLRRFEEMVLARTDVGEEACDAQVLKKRLTIAIKALREARICPSADNDFVESVWK